MIVLVCGGRAFCDHDLVDTVLSRFVSARDIVVHGGAKGADSCADYWAKSRGVHRARVDALWDFYGKKAAGPVCNSAMLFLNPALCVAFPGQGGTADMVRQCREAKIPVIQADRELDGTIKTEQLL